MKMWNNSSILLKYVESFNNRDQNGGSQGLGLGEMGDVGQRVQSSIYKMNKCPGDLIYSMMIVVNCTVFYIWKLLRA